MLRDFRESGGWRRGFRHNGTCWRELKLLLLFMALTVTALFITPAAGRTSSPAANAQNPAAPQTPGLPGPQQQPNAPPEPTPQPGLSPKQKQELLKSGFQQMKKDSDQLLELARSLQKDLDKSNQNVLSVKVVDKAERIEKLAKKIKNTARGY